MSQPERNRREVDAGLKEVHGRRVPDHVRGHAFGRQARAGRGRPADGFVQEVRDAMAGQARSVRIGKGVIRQAVAQFLKPLAQDPRGTGPEWHDALLATFPQQLHHGAGTEPHVRAAERREFRHPGARVVQREQQRVVAPAGPRGPVAGDEQRVHFLAREEGDESSRGAFEGNGQDPRRQVHVIGRPKGDEARERSQRRETGVAAAAVTTQDLSALPGNHFEDLKHTKPGFYSVRINDQYRLIFRFENGNAHDVYIEGEDHSGRGYSGDYPGADARRYEAGADPSRRDLRGGVPRPHHFATTNNRCSREFGNILRMVK